MMRDFAIDAVIIVAGLLLFGVPLAAAACIMAGWIYNLFHPRRRR